MTDESLSDHARDARALRALVLDRRESLADRAERSQHVWARLSQLPAFVQTRAVAFYVSVRSEVETRAALANRLQRSQPTAVPFCQGDQLRLFWLQTMAELAKGTFGVLEPLPAVRASTRQRGTHVREMDAILVPGVVFDRGGGRWGYGRGFYDRLLEKSPATVAKIGLAFECQMVDHLELGALDVPMDYVVTEDRIYERAAR